MHHIPYTTEIRPDTGLTNPKLGMWLFLASEVMLFGSLFSSYALLRTGATSWPDQSAALHVPLATLNTVILLSSSITMGLAWRAVRNNLLSRFRLLMGLTLLLGVAFLTIKGFEYGDKLSHGLLPSTNNFLGLYFTLTAVHALHLVIGVLINAYLVGPGFGMVRRDAPRFANRVELSAMYWHFVDMIWIVMFSVLYLL